MTKSPFYVVKDFISAGACEDVIDMCEFNVPDQDKDAKAVKTTKTCERAEQMLYERLQYVLPELQAHYEILYKGTERMQFEWFPEGSSSQPAAESSIYVRGKWLRTRERDLTCVLFLSDYQDTPPFDSEFEAYGGKLEFPQHHFGFNPQRGTMIVFPSDPHFINLTSNVFVGDAYQVRIQLAAKTPFLYNPSAFPGDYRVWF